MSTTLIRVGVTDDIVNRATKLHSDVEETNENVSDTMNHHKRYGRH